MGRSVLHENHAQPRADSEGNNLARTDEDLILENMSVLGMLDPRVIMRTMQEDDQHFDYPKKKVVEAGEKLQATMEHFYPFGYTTEVCIPIECIVEPPATMCYRKLNVHHVENIMMEMIENPTQVCHTAELVPFNPVDGRLVPLVGAHVSLAKFLKVARRLKYFAVSGQHSAQAAKNILKRAADGDLTVKHLVPKLKERTARILDRDTPRVVLVELSRRSNVSNKTLGKFCSPFMESIEHARNQYADLGQPKRTEGGKLTAKSSSEFKVNNIVPMLIHCFI
jgi:hypothetical protein